MAIIQADYFSHVLMRRVPFIAILPTDRVQENGTYEAMPERGYQTLYLIHGITDDCSDWITGTRIKIWAMERNLAVIMPSGENSFYVSSPVTGRDYGEFVGRELVEQTRRMFPLSHRREDTFLGGQSMGGFGALRNGLQYHDTFGSIIALSSALHLYEPGYDHHTDPFGSYQVFGNREETAVTDMNPRVVAKALADERDQGLTNNIPRIYMDCGRQDELHAANMTYLAYLRELGFEVTYQDVDGVHGWAYWDQRMPLALEWLPLEERGQFVGQNN